ncbi:MAG: hypothetical protein RMJ59_06455 [Candidatus Nitrosocaldus sp.]|nr:hypothetical protein [Candidatus Nitrosocaldus sp.]
MYIHNHDHSTSLVSMLSMLKSRAIRSRVWYRALSIHERVLVGLVGRYIQDVRNRQLAIVLARIAMKLSIAVNQFIRAEQHGFAKAYAWLKGLQSGGMGVRDASMCTCMSMNSLSIMLPSRGIIEWFTMLEMSMVTGRWHY